MLKLINSIEKYGPQETESVFPMLGLRQAGVAMDTGMQETLPGQELNDRIIISGDPMLYDKIY